MAEKLKDSDLARPLKDVIEGVTAMLKHSPCTVPFISGAPGVGKSDACIEIGKRLGMEPHRIELIHVNDYQVEDFTGIPDISQAQTVFRPTAMLKKFDTTSGPGLIVLEELAQASVHHQTWAGGFIHERRNNTFALHPEVRIIATGNRPQDRTGAKKVLPHLMDRMCQIEVVTSDIDSWASWALRAKIRPDGIAFLKWRPDLLNTYDPDETTNATQRSWTKVFREIPDHIDDATYLMLATGFVGEGPAGEWVRTRDLIRQLPTMEEIRANPSKATVPTEVSTCWAATVGLAATSSPKTIDADFTYMERMPPEFTMAFVSDVQEAAPEVVQTKRFIQFCSENQATFVGTAEEDALAA